MEEIPFWEETYRNRDINTFPAEPNGTVLEFEHLLKKDSVILEAGCVEEVGVDEVVTNVRQSFSLYTWQRWYSLCFRIF